MPEKKRLFNVLLSESDHTALSLLAQSSHETKSQVIRLIIRDYAKRAKINTPQRRD